MKPLPHTCTGRVHQPCFTRCRMLPMATRSQPFGSTYSTGRPDTAPQIAGDSQSPKFGLLRDQ